MEEKRVSNKGKSQAVKALASKMAQKKVANKSGSAYLASDRKVQDRHMRAKNQVKLGSTSLYRNPERAKKAIPADEGYGGIYADRPAYKDLPSWMK